MKYPFSNKVAWLGLQLISLCLILSACNTRKGIVHNPVADKDQARKIVVFIDGTRSKEESYTNVSKLYNLVTLQNDPKIIALYLRGVGNGADVAGMVLGSGVRKEVSKAYLFLAEHYNYSRGDEIYIFGFSRGAYAARMLTGFIYSAGIVELDQVEISKRKSFVRNIFDAQKGQKSLTERRNAVKAITGQDLNPDDFKIEFLGLWDTVASLGLPDYDDNYYVPQTKFLDQLCNVKRASQALSLNDNRGSVFTPALLTHSILKENCQEIDLDEVVNEVWFFGAHSDVGGGRYNSYLSGVSLNWMIREIKPYGLLSPTASVYENRYDKTSDPRQGFYKIVYPKSSRKLVYFTSRDDFRDKKLKIHQSVLDRLEFRVKTNEITLLEFFGDCFKKNQKGGYSYKADADCFDVVQ